MRTLHASPAAVPRSLLLLFSCSLCFAVCAPLSHAETSSDYAGAPPVPLFSPSAPGQQKPSPSQSVSVASPTPRNIYSIPPEDLGDLMMIHQRYLAAVEAYQRAPRDSAVVWNKLGMAYQHMYALDIAKLQYEKALQLNPKYAEAINNLGTVYYAKKSYRRAVNQYKSALRLAPDSASILSNLGTAYFARKQYENAMKAYEMAVAIDPDIFEQHSSQGVMVQERTIEERAGYFYILAKTCAKAGMTDRTLQYIRKALENGFKDRDKFKADPEFSSLQDNPEFQQILAAEYKVL